MNIEFFRLINNLANKNSILDKIMIFFSKDALYIFIAALAIVFILGAIQKKSDYRKIAVSTFILTSINLISSFLIGNIYYVDRPFVNNKVNLLYPHVKDASFPSDHSIGTMSIALGLTRYNKVISFLLTVLSVMVGFSRVYVGHHYPMDVIGAYIIAFGVSYVYNLKLRNKVESLYEAVERKLVFRFGLGKLYEEI
ncbi:undecaprenyl-diphosphatase [Clostridium saccharobutylicum]|uniref:Undecaprenyl-diphosphatase BcrC n=1 Tax=Clostridium saccharobutylicum DSM 13864 TaxID=1345695 RepID=U5MWM0_CLOSA|nr:undecaprenyl-diphosphatase [Clostridium saccharobutylicum]AGX43857.1 undecaprenyl-diphosphatase BcrC [Clostridium saccharobutylicum DSM 13864]AQR91158.1 undecaprenyl-diphosphatase BcrC [Clostridium saccharobutylicum]AQS01062.1 undecaprenyl-diphosphatase BcrC [Clostridium saccharobutylicum]AQS10797.1 undecaprenyl-diphosphatase BcrC [Clostridium saccharobutylicum]AQS15045.1 undecaprenyl-diphosphatase BcrC [Clostridium saccharobutylicum]